MTTDPSTLELPNLTLKTLVRHPVSERVRYAPGNEHYSRARPGQRVHELFERRVDLLRQHGYGRQLAVDTGELTVTYAELDARANQLARHLLASGARSGDRIALLYDQPLDFYLGMLAVSKMHAAYVPLDVAFPADRIGYIVGDSGATLVATTRSAAAKVAGLSESVPGAEPLYTDDPGLGELPRHRLTDDERGRPIEDLAYLIYTSGTTGRPKGVMVSHQSICNFVQVAAEKYGYLQTDRVYQGLTIAFDFSVEEIWVPWMAGATLVPKPAGASLLGADLHEFLVERGITAMCCVPTLLATLEEDVPGLRLLLVSGEACPQDLIARWHREDRRFLNVYGPTEATVTATWTELRPDKPVTIGAPLPSYAIVILDPDDPGTALPFGLVGEIGIAGVGLAEGYLNQPERTEQAFIPDFLDIPANPSGRIYRTGDLGRVNDDGDVEYLGRIDLQVKVRGYRIELTEIESVLLQVPGVASAVVNTFEPTPGGTELVGYYSLRADTLDLDEDLIVERLREQLPHYMVPAYLERLSAIPMTTSDKADRAALPPPTGRRAARHDADYVAPASELERRLAEALSATLGVARVSATGNFFDDLGASSLGLSQFAAAVRRQDGMPTVSIRQMYQNPSIRQLAAALDGSLEATAEAAAAAAAGTAPAAATPEVVRTSGVGFVLTGVAQLVIGLAFTLLAGFILDRGFQYLLAAPNIGALYLRGLGFTVAVFALWVALPIVAKWTLVGRWKQTEFPLWGPRYLRLWLVKSLVRANPMALFAGSPLYLWYLRALGAKIGRNVAIFSRSLPVATDLITVGEGTVIRRDVAFSGYRAIRGHIQVGPVTLGRHVVVGEKTVLDVDTAMGDHAQLGHASSLSAGQRVPAGQSWHGTPARPSGGVDYRGIASAKVGWLRKTLFSLWQLLVGFGVGPVLLGVLMVIVTRVPLVNAVLTRGQSFVGNRWFYLAVAGVSIGLLVLFGLLGLAVMVVLPRLLAKLVKPGRVYPLYGPRYLAQLLVGALSNAAPLVLLLGDSSFITTFLRALGYQMTPLVQTGSNFGTQHVHDSPTLTTIGSGTVISDGLSVQNMRMSNTSFRVDRVVIGGRNFLGNNIAFPSDARTGSNVLLATKVMVPIDGPVRHDTGLLGSPAFEIPRVSAARAEFTELDDPERVRRRVRRKNWYNAGTLAAALLSQTVGFFLLLQLAALGLAFYSQHRIVAVVVATLAMLVVGTSYGLFMERLSMGFRRLRPRQVSIYDRYFWSHERLWKFYTNPLLAGTPFQTLLWRLSGLKVGKRLFDDGTAIPEKTLVRIGDDVSLNAGTVIQNHSLEDGVFTSDYSTIGSGATIGPAGFVHLGVTMGEGSVLDANAFLLKGTETAPHTSWVGNPAEEARRGQ